MMMRALETWTKATRVRAMVDSSWRSQLTGVMNLRGELAVVEKTAEGTVG